MSRLESVLLSQFIVLLVNVAVAEFFVESEVLSTFPNHKVALAVLASISPTRDAQKVVIVVLAGNESVLMSASTSLSISAPAAATLAVSVTSAPSSTLIATNSQDLLIEPVSPTTDCTASVWSCLLQLPVYTVVDALSVVATTLSHTSKTTQPTVPPTET